MTPTDARVDVIATCLEQGALLVIRELLDRSELSTTASDVLHQLDAEGPARLTALAAAAGVSQPAMTQLIQRFERRGLIERALDPTGGRASLVVVTDAGRALLREQRHMLRVRRAERLSALDADQQAALELATQVTLPIIARLIGKDESQRLEEVPA